VKQIVAIEFDDGNLSGFGWNWKFMVTCRKDGTFSVSAKQTTADPPAMRIPHRHPLRTGQDVWEALEEMVEDAGYAISDNNVEDIVAKISKLDRRIAKEIREATVAE
jgi:hypothetical protein